jgi:hypothetical protein
MTTTPAAPVAAPPELLRTPRDGCFKVRSGSLGSYLAPADDPLANVEITKEQFSSFEMHEGFDKIPATLWSRWLLLCLDLAKSDTGTLEVSCRLLRHEDDPSRWRIIVPLQDVCAASVRVDTFDDSVDIETGERITSYPPEGWVPMGSSHSHNTMTLDRFSSTDDGAELGDPGVHILISHCSSTAKKLSWKQTDSIVAGKRRFYLPAGSLTEAVTALEPYHPDAREQVMHLRPRGFGAKEVRWSAKIGDRHYQGTTLCEGGPLYPDSLQSSWQDDPFFWSDEPMPPTSDRATLDDGPGEGLVSFYRSGKDEEWMASVNGIFTEIEDTLTTLICTGEEQEAVDVLDLLARLAEGDTSFLHPRSHAHPNYSSDWPA